MWYYFGHKQYKQFVLELDERLNNEINQIVDTWEEFIANKLSWLPLSDEQAEFYEANPTATALQVRDRNIPEPTIPPVEDAEKKAFDAAKWKKLDEIRNADENSNKFYISIVSDNVEIARQELWIDKDLRNSLYSITLPALKAEGIVTTKLWTNTTPPVGIEVPVDWAMEKLPLLEVYAKQTYDIRCANEAAVYNALVISDLDAINANVGYPEHLVFTLEV